MDRGRAYDELIAEASDLVALGNSVSALPDSPSSSSEVGVFQDTFQAWFERSLALLPDELGTEFRQIASAPVLERAPTWTVEHFVANPTAREPDLQPYDGRTGRTISPQRYHPAYPFAHCFERPMGRLVRFLRRGRAHAQLGGPRTADPAPTAAGIGISDLHPEVVDVAGRLFAEGHFDLAVLEAARRLIASVSSLSGRSSRDPAKMMELVFSPDRPLIEVYRDPRDRRGVQAMFVAAVLGIRNRLSHPDATAAMTSIEAIEWLAFLSALFRLLDRRTPLDAPHVS